MARLRNDATGVVVNVEDSKRLDGYSPVEQAKAPAKATPKKAASTKASDSE